MGGSRRIPGSLNLAEIQAALRDIHQRLDQWDRAGVFDMKGRRIVNAGKEVSQRDYILKDEVDRRLAVLERRIVLASRNAGTATTQGGGGTLPPSTYPAPNHPMDFSYYYVDRPSYGDPDWGDFYDEVKSFTTGYIAWQGFGYAISDTPLSEWRVVMQERMARAAADNRNTNLLVSLRNPWAEGQIGGDSATMNFCLDVAGPVWDKVVRVDLVDEVVSDPDELSRLADQMRNKIASRRLQSRPIGATFTRSTWDEGAIFDSNLDFFTCEAYLDAPGPPTPQEAAQVLTDELNGRLSMVPSGKDIVIVVQGYSRNLEWTDLDTLRALQGVPYMVSYQDPRVVALQIFSYGRKSGTRYTDTNQGGHLGVEHRGMGAAIIGAPFAGQSSYVAPWGGIYKTPVQEAINRARNIRAVAAFDGAGRLIAGSEPTFRNAVTDILLGDFRVKARSDPFSTYHIQVKPIGADILQESYQIWEPNAAGGKIVTGSAAYVGTKVPADAW